MESNTEKKPGTNLQNSYKSDNFCYRKVGRAITKWEPIEKYRITSRTKFRSGNKNYFAF